MTFSPTCLLNRDTLNPEKASFQFLQSTKRLLSYKITRELKQSLCKWRSSLKDSISFKMILTSTVMKKILFLMNKSWRSSKNSIYNRKFRSHLRRQLNLASPSKSNSLTNMDMSPKLILLNWNPVNKSQFLNLKMRMWIQWILVKRWCENNFYLKLTFKAKIILHFSSYFLINNSCLLILCSCSNMFPFFNK